MNEEYEMAMDYLKDNADEREDIHERIIQLEAENARIVETAKLGIENIAAQCRLCLNHCGINERQPEWVRNEIANEERIALAALGVK